MVMSYFRYGPSVADEMPVYLVIERFSRSFHDIDSSTTVYNASKPPQARLDGFLYSGAYFKPQEWATLKKRYDHELQDYTNACLLRRTKRLPPDVRSPHHNKSSSPPDDLASLKFFVRMGRQHFKQRRDNAKFAQVQAQVKRLATKVHRFQKLQQAPQRVILYLEGLDCAGKSSTGMLIIQALQECGFDAKVSQHNRPPTPEQALKPWMDRSRFEYPDDMYEEWERQQGKVPENIAVVWDRGPAGDFVYGGLDKLSIDKKLERYEQFREYDRQCFDDGVLFLKCFFVSDRDTIAATLGKRLAHKQIVRDLRIWLDANSKPHVREGLDAIAAHVDPTDFVAFNKYDDNLLNFTDFVR
jgi:polyphosphate kinase 2 (PPK2 family)